MSENLSLIDIIKIIAKWWWLVAIVSILCASGMYVYSEYFEDDIYVSKGSFYIRSATTNIENITIATLNANTRFSETYIELAKSDSVLEKVSQELVNKGYQPASAVALRSVLRFSVLNETEVLEVSAENRDPQKAQDITNAVLKVAPQEIKNIVKAGGAEVVDEAKLPTQPTYPNVLKKTLIGFFVGFVIGCVIIFILEFFDLRIKPDNNLEEMYGIPVIGNIPEIKK